MKKKLLLFNPPVRGDADYAYQLSVVLNHPKAFEWLYCNYINIYFNDDDPNNPIRFFYMDLSNRHDRLWDTKNPFLDYQIIHKDTISSFHINIVTFIIEMINQNNYVYLYLNEEKMNNRKKTGSLRLHVNMFYGFDDELELFYIVGYDDANNYSYSTISFSELLLAYEKKYRHFYNDKNMIYIFKLNNNEIDYNFDINAVITQLKEFVNSSDPTLRFPEYINPNQDLTYGLNVYRKYINFLDFEKRNLFPIKIKPMYNLWEHKKLMNARLEYFTSNNLISKASLAISYYQELEKKFCTMKNLLIKASLKQNYSSYTKIVTILEECIHIEQIAIETLLKELKS